MSRTAPGTADRRAAASRSTVDNVDPEPAAATRYRHVIDRGAGPLVVLLHGQPGEGRDWAPLVGALEVRHRVLAPDRPGWGRSVDAPMGVAENADWLEAMLAALAGPERAVVVGHSFGGGVALSLALRHPGRVRALVLVGSVGHRRALSGLDHLLALPRLGAGIVRGGIVMARSVAYVAGRRAARSDPMPPPDRGPESLTMMRVLAGTEPFPEHAWRTFLVEQHALVRETPVIQASLSSVEVPTVVVAGSRDIVVPLIASRLLAANIPGAELTVVAGVGHLLPVEAPECLAEVVERYARLAPG